MKNIPYKQRLVTITGLVFMIGLLLFFVYRSIVRNDTTSGQQGVSQETFHTHHGEVAKDDTPADPKAERVFVKDLHRHDDSVDSQARLYIEEILYSYVVDASKNKLDLYTGTIRPASYTVDTTENFHTTKMLVDIEPANLTYLVSILRDKKTDGQTIYVSCAPSVQQMDDAAVCKQGLV